MVSAFQHEEERRFEMTNINKQIATALCLLGGIMALTLLSSCERRPLGTCENDAYMMIPVKIDWSQSGFPETPSSKDPDDYVHRVSIRFFPKSGGEAFDRYLETNVTKGEIMVPIGEYSVIIFNESVYDVSWNDAIRFSDIDNYELFAANKVQDKNPQNYFNIEVEEPLIVEPPRLASWSLSDFKVMPTMDKNGEMYNALTKAVMYPLTYDVKILAHVSNLKSAQQIMGHKKGFASKVYMASRQTGTTASSFIFKFNGRKWTDSQQIDGTTEWAFRSFGRTASAQKKYFVNMHVILTNGQKHEPDSPLLFDVTDQVNAAYSKAPSNKINIELQDIKLPEVTDGVFVGDWDDEDFIIQ